MTEHQQAVAREYLRVGPKHKVIARAIGGTPDGVRSTLRKLRKSGRVPTKVEPVQWPIGR